MPQRGPLVTQSPKPAIALSGSASARKADFGAAKVASEVLRSRTWPWWWRRDHRRCDELRRRRDADHRHPPTNGATGGPAEEHRLLADVGAGRTGRSGDYLDARAHALAEVHPPGALVEHHPVTAVGGVGRDADVGLVGNGQRRGDPGRRWAGSSSGRDPGTSGCPAKFVLPALPPKLDQPGLARDLTLTWPSEQATRAVATSVAVAVATAARVVPTGFAGPMRVVALAASMCSFAADGPG